MNAGAAPSAADKEKAEMSPLGLQRGRDLLAPRLAKAFGVQGLAPVCRPA